MHRPWFPQLADPSPARIDLICFPHAGGGASLYYRWSSQIPETIRLVPVRLPGREQRYREPAFRSIEPLAEAVGRALRDRPGCPFVLLGQSMGALVAFELARWLRRGGHRQPHGLVVASAVAPQIASFPDPIHGLPRAQFLDQLQRRYGGLRTLHRPREPLCPGHRPPCRPAFTGRLDRTTPPAVGRISRSVP